ncbi:acyl--CoA ligase [Acidimicrobiales bacterium]|jgi:acyl-CoA synthetase (AMP-forming)/AMP-acid ligase II|nr:acyl--CoA ligase [bacterium]MDB9845818.1 acyl--CoA ligase [Acidimicrobiales bacterium]
MTTLDLFVQRAVAAHPDTEALIDAPNRASFFSGEPQRLSWGDVDNAVNGVASALQAAGVAAGDAVAIQLPNAVELPISLLACFRIGAVATPFPIQHREHELRHGLATSGARHLITAGRPDRDDILETSMGVLAEFDAAMFTFGPASIEGATPLSLPEGPAPVPEPHVADPSDVATICWTSGTTGTPKGVPRAHNMWLASSDVQVTELDLTADERILCPFPVVNMAGIGGMLVPWLQTGSTLLLHHPIDLPVFLGQIGSEAISYTVAPPPLLNMLLGNEAMLDSIDMSHIRKISSGSAPLAPWMVEGWQDRGIEIVNVFGSNEGAAMLSTMASVPDPNERARYFPAPSRLGIEARLVDLETGEEITEPGQQGELRFAGPTIFSGYLESDGSEFDDAGFYRTGDIFEIADSDGPRTLYRFVDRAKDIIIRGGMNVSAAEIETLVSSHDAVAECAVVAYPDDDLGERVGVFVVAAAESEPDLDAVVEHLRAQKIASYKLPERLETIDALPRNPVGKVVKADLRARWQ